MRIVTGLLIPIIASATFDRNYYFTYVSSTWPELGGAEDGTRDAGILGLGLFPLLERLVDEVAAANGEVVLAKNIVSAWITVRYVTQLRKTSA